MTDRRLFRASAGHAADAPRLFHRVLIANRGEVAARIARTCDALGIEPIFAVSQADRDAPYTRGRQVVALGPGRADQSYLDPQRLVQAALQSRASAVHPGWGFLSETPAFAALCTSHGLSFIGPPAHVMQLMGSKIPAKRAMRAAGLDVIPGSAGVLSGIDEARRVASEVGYPVLLKAERGGGGRGMRIARDEQQLESAYEDAQSEARAAFGDASIYLERLVEGGRHIEIQIFADGYGNVIHLGERDCTVQRHHQKLIEESPSPALSDAARAGEAAARAAASIGYVGAGTMEFLLDEDGVLRFMEMNTRLQVEHTVTEMRGGFDLVREQIFAGAGHTLSFEQADVELSGHAIECRINAEDPDDGFRPAPGTITRFEAPPDEGGDVRIDTHVQTGYEVPPHYDSLLCKVIARGRDRDDAIDRMRRALSSLVCEGVPTTAPAHLAILGSSAFRDGDYDTSRIPEVG